MWISLAESLKLKLTSFDTTPYPLFTHKLFSSMSQDFKPLLYI